MMRRVVCVLVAVATWPWLQGHPADGSWRAEFIEPGGGRRSITFRLEVTGESLEGSVLLGRRSVPIEQGRVEAESLSFRGRVAGEALHLVQESRGGTRELIARKVG
jgi:hypothetical protein